MDQPFYVRVRRMKGDAAHGHALVISYAPAGQGQIEFPRSRQGIVIEHFIKIA